MDRVDSIHERLADLEIELTGDSTIERRNEPAPVSIASRASRATSGWTSTAAPTGTHRRQYEIAAEAFAPVLARLRELMDTARGARGGDGGRGRTVDAGGGCLSGRPSEAGPVRRAQ